MASIMLMKRRASMTPVCEPEVAALHKLAVVEIVGSCGWRDRGTKCADEQFGAARAAYLRITCVR